MEVVPVPVLADNYAYLLVDAASRECAAVDPVEPGKVLAAAAAVGARVTKVLTTHAHWDHAGGNVEMVKRVKEEAGREVEVVGGARDGIPGCTVPVKEGDEVVVGEAVSVRVLDVPCHTPGHVAFVARCTAAAGSGQSEVVTPVVFTGDTLFVGGCGNFNSGTPQQMHHALIESLGRLDDATRVFVGHNYTERNLRWAQHVEPENKAVAAKLAQARQLDAASEFIPSTIGEEKQHNPFMRCVVPEIQTQFGCSGDPVATLLKIRQGKDVWGQTH